MQETPLSLALCKTPMSLPLHTPSVQTDLSGSPSTKNTRIRYMQRKQCSDIGGSIQTSNDFGQPGTSDHDVMACRLDICSGGSSFSIRVGTGPPSRGRPRGLPDGKHLDCLATRLCCRLPRGPPVGEPPDYLAALSPAIPRSPPNEPKRTRAKMTTCHG